MNTTDGIQFYYVNDTKTLSLNETGNSLTILVTLSSTNSTENASILSDSLVSPYKPWEQVLIAVALAILIIGTIIGNSVVCLAVAIVKGLRTPYNLLIVSLAISDLLVALLVMPLYANVSDPWILATRRGRCAPYGRPLTLRYVRRQF